MLAKSSFDFSPWFLGWEKVIMPVMADVSSLIASTQSRTVLITMKGFPRLVGGELRQKSTPASLSSNAEIFLQQEVMANWVALGVLGSESLVPGHSLDYKN
jgi:hypothetical protein